MTIKILDSWLREYLKTKADPGEIAEALSLTSVSVEKTEKYNNDYLYEIEVTTNRPDLYSVLGLARETTAVLTQFGKEAHFIPLDIKRPQIQEHNPPLKIINDPKLVNRICAVLMEVKTQKSPPLISGRLESSGIRSLNNVIDITNYVMRVVGHPTHVFDFDRLNTDTLKIREAKKGETIKTLDGKNYSLRGGEIVAENEKGEIVDLLGIMGLENSVVTEKTKRILYFIDNNSPTRIRNASMGLSIRTEAATLNEKGVDPELVEVALFYGIELFEKIANGKIISDIIDIYPNKPSPRNIEVPFEKINKIIGVEINPKKITEALSILGFNPKLTGNTIKVEVPSFRLNDVNIEEDIIEEIARIYGYHNLQSLLPPTEESITANPFIDDFYWENRIKKSLKYWGYTETYTYSFVPEDMFEGPLEDAVQIDNPLTEDFVYMRNTLIPSLLKVVSGNKGRDKIKIFELANVYLKRPGNLPDEVSTLAGVIKKERADFFEIKGLIEQLAKDLGIKNLSFKKSEKGGIGASLYIGREYLGEIEVLDTKIVDFELNFSLMLKHVSQAKEFKPFAKYPPITEDLTVVASSNISTDNLISMIKKQDIIVVEVTLKDSYKDSRTFHIVYQDFGKNLTNEDVAGIREKIVSSLKSSFNAAIK